VRCEVATGNMDLSAEPPGYTYIKNARHGMTGEMIRAEFSDGPVTTHLSMNGEPRTQVLIGDGPGGLDSRSGSVVHGDPYRTGGMFAAVLEPVDQSARPVVSAIQCSKQEGAVRAEISVVTQRHRHAGR